MTTCWYLYLIRTHGGALYTGVTTDVPRRLEQHRQGRGAKALRGKGPLTLAFHCPAGDHSNALRWEYRIKQLTRIQKEQLVAHQPPSLEDLWPSMLPGDVVHRG
ncbi:GIY-YIG nuclease family protein [Acerihabitans sp. TG2]|uniref:GIY-YIG nuclease family protein n=1 Tax=Acerihabitans sp. TG2 TaxID=3096008 RepID=UPI002B22BC0D|nr:GIY-YIG nuclease family protein [Acerihabitans sp. TG2]MEA9392918.1 GIY-YIG nuclease family protein [Acerihabitans sp. TG2]